MVSMRWIGWFAFGSLIVCAWARADIVFFAAGGQAQLPARIDGDGVTLSAPDGPIQFQRDDFRKIVPGFDPVAEWPAIRDRGERGKAQERLAAAWWALEHGLTDEAEEALRAAYAVEPSCEPVARLIAVLDRLKLPCPDPGLESVRKLLGPRASIARGRHTILIHDAVDSEASERVAMLDRVVITFYLSLTAHGIDLKPLDRKLASVRFPERREYLACLRAEGAGAFSTTRGYYHPTKGFVLTYDVRSDPLRRRALEVLAKRNCQYDLLDQSLAGLSPGSKMLLPLPGETDEPVSREIGQAILAKYRRELARRKLLLSLECRELDMGTAAHETIHQLVAASGLVSRHAEFPFWLHEGLAMQFEVVRGGRWAGFGRINDQRLGDWRKIDPPPHLAPLVGDRGFGQGYQAALYAQAWALVYYVRKEHPQHFVAWIDDLRRSGGVNVREHRAGVSTFARAFGADLPAIESSWHVYINQLHTPAEDADTVVPEVPAAAHSN
jgi:hypothetical protein